MKASIAYIIETEGLDNDSNNHVLDHLSFADYEEALELYSKIYVGSYVKSVQLVEEIMIHGNVTRRVLERKSL